MVDAAQPQRAPALTLTDMRRMLLRGEIALATVVLGILAIMLVPLPPWMLDGLLAISVTSSILVLMTALLIKKPLEFTAFPSVLLISTLLRLSLNIATTRLILANGHSGEHAAGEVIAAFANFVMSGNFVIGVIVFTGLTAYDTQKIKESYDSVSHDGTLAGKGAIMGALSLYLDFINLFLMLLTLLGDRR